MQNHLAWLMINSFHGNTNLIRPNENMHILYYNYINVAFIFLRTHFYIVCRKHQN